MKNAVKILVVDDELGIRDLLSSELRAHDFYVATASNGVEAVDRVKKEKFNLVISDVMMPRMDGLDMLDAVKKIDPDIEVIMSTGYGTIETAVAAMKRGAYDFVQKPFNLDEILALVGKALEKNDLKAMLGVYESSKAIFSSIKLDALLPIMARLSAQILKADDACIMLMAPEGELVMAAAVGLEEGERQAARLALGERVAGKVAKSKEPVLIEGPLEKDPRFSNLPSLRDIRSSVVFPLLVGEETLGVLCLNRTVREEPFTAAELRHATIFGSQIAQALYNAKLYRELEMKIQQIQEMQAHLVQSEKLAAIGQLAAGVAHEINNPLTGIMGFTEMVLQSPGLSLEQREDLESVLHQSRRCRKIVQNLLQFGRRRKPQEELIALDKILEPTLELVRCDLRAANIAIEVAVAEDLPLIYGDSSQLEQVFLNLIVNARQALAGRESAFLKIQIFRKGAKIIFVFEDNGPGIAANILAQVFDPFFTTKPIGKGTGLGLSVSYGIIEQHQGTIRVESAVGVGTTFIIELPIRAPKGPEGA